MVGELSHAPELLRQENKSGAFEDLARSAVYSAFQSPVNGAVQLVDKVAGTNIAPSVQVIRPPCEAEFGSTNWHAQQVGSAAGMIPWIFTLHKGSSCLLNRAIVGIETKLGSQTLVKSVVQTEGAVAARAGERFFTCKTAVEVGASAMSGLAYGALLTPTLENEDFLSSRARNAFSSAATFMTLSTSSRALESFGVKNKVLAGAASGLPAGIVSAESHSILSGKGSASGKEVLQSMYGFTIIGGGFGFAQSRIGSRVQTDHSAKGTEIIETSIGTEQPISGLDWRTQPMPELRSTKTALDYHQIPIDITGKLNKQRVVNVKEYGIASSSAYAQPNAPYYRSFATALEAIFIREAVAEKLAQANKKLRPYGAELLALDGYRPIDLQHELWDHFIKKGREALTNPTEKDLEKFAGQFCSDPRGFDPNDFRTWPVHNTGGAIDVTLRSLRTGQELFMGSIFDDADAVSSSRHFEKPEVPSQSALEAQRNRRLLFHAMREVGFANYHHEWWHFDYGTQMWVMNGGHCGPALFGRTTLTPGTVTAAKGN